MAHIFAQLTYRNYAYSPYMRYLKHYCSGALDSLQEFIRAIDGQTRATLMPIRLPQAWKRLWNYDRQWDLSLISCNSDSYAEGPESVNSEPFSNVKNGSRLCNNLVLFGQFLADLSPSVMKPQSMGSDYLKSHKLISRQIFSFFFFLGKRERLCVFLFCRRKHG